jgi:hypothetical protein
MNGSKVTDEYPSFRRVVKNFGGRRKKGTSPAIQTAALADMLDQKPTAGNSLRLDLDLVRDLDLDLDILY